MSNLNNAYNKKATTGMIWASSGVVVAKFSSFIAQLFLGWMLSKNDFGLYAIAISTASLIAPLQNGGVHKILIQRCHEYDRLAPGLLKIALVFNFLLMTVIIMAMAFLARAYKAPELPLLLTIIAISIPLNTPAAILRTKLQSRLDFSKYVKIDTTSSILRNGSMILFAFAGCGALSFVLPLIVVALFEGPTYLWFVGSWPRGNVDAWKLFKEIFKDTRWIMLGALVLTLSMQGDYLVIGLLKDKTVLGTYFFAFQLSIAFAVLFTNGIDQVMMPSFAQLADQSVRQTQAFLKAFRVLFFVICPVVVGTTLLIDPLIKICWAGKWNTAIIATQFLLLSLLTRLPMSLSQSYLESKGRWRLRATLQGIDTLGMMISAAIGAWLGDVFAIALSVGAYRFVFGLLFCLYGTSAVGISAKQILTPIYRVMLNCFFAGAVSFIGAYSLGAGVNLLLKASMLAISFGTIFFGIAILFQRDRMNEVMAMVKRG